MLSILPGIAQALIASFSSISNNGFNAGSLNLVASRRNGAGISPKSPLLLKFCAGFDIDAAKALASRDDASFRGALDLLLVYQKDYLKAEAA